MVVEPKKSLGQHWLHDETFLREIALASFDQRAQTIVEIGPGLGTLTSHLLEYGLPLIALEYDPELARSLPLRLQNNPLLKVIEQDVRTFNLTSLKGDYIISANIPYYLTSHLIRILCDTPSKPLRVALLIQKEVAERIASKPGKMSLIACVTQYFYDVSLGSIVKAQFFTPPPKVDSQVLVLSKKAPQFHAHWPTLLRIFKAGFSEKRKNLRNALSGGLALSKEKVELLLHNARIDPTRRAESLSMSEWKQLYDAFQILDSLSDSSVG